MVPITPPPGWTARRRPQRWASNGLCILGLRSLSMDASNGIVRWKIFYANVELTLQARHLLQLLARCCLILSPLLLTLSERFRTLLGSLKDATSWQLSLRLRHYWWRPLDLPNSIWSYSSTLVSLNSWQLLTESLPALCASTYTNFGSLFLRAMNVDCVFVYNTRSESSFE